MAVNINVPSQVKTYANLAAFPATGALKTIYIAEDTNKTYRWTGSVYTEISASAAMTWGAIGGTLSNQTDLQSALDAKVPTSRTLTINGVTQDLSANRTFTISTGITIGSTAIASGVVGRVLFEGAGNVVQESANFTFDSVTNLLTTNGSILVGSSLISASAYPLQVVGGAGGSALFSNTTRTQALNINLTTANETRIYSDYFLTGADQKLILGTFANRANQLVLNTTGNVLIGTTTDAGFRLDVNGTARVQNVLTIQNLTADLYVRTTAWSGQSRIWFGDDSSDTIGGINYEHQFDRMNLRTNAGTRMTLFSTGNVGINTTTDAGFRLDVNGDARVVGNMQVAKNQNGSTQLIVSNLNNNAASYVSLKLTSSGGSAEIGRCSASYTTVKIIQANDTYIYNPTSNGNISILNDFATGQIRMAAGGSSTAQMTLKASGVLNLSSVPTSSAGLSTGDIWNDAGTLKIV